MYYPGLDDEKISELSEEDILDKITELQRRIGLVYYTGHTEVINQLRGLIQHYQNILQEKREKAMQDMIDADPKLGRKVIDIDWPDPYEEEDKKDNKPKSK